MTLLSNTGDFSTNKTNHFRVLLPKPLSFVGNWEVALLDIQYPVSWNTLKALEGRLVLNCFHHNNLRIPVNIRIPSGYYRNVQELIQAVQQAIEKKGERLPNIFYKADLAIYKLQKLKVHDMELYKIFARDESPEKLISFLRNPKLIPDPRPQPPPEVAKKKKRRTFDEVGGGPIRTDIPSGDQSNERKRRRRRRRLPSEKEETTENTPQPEEEKEVVVPFTEDQIRAHKKLALLRKNVKRSRQTMEQSTNMLSKVLKVSYSEEKQRVIIEWHPTMSIKTIKFDHTLQFMLGFGSKRKIEKGINVADYNIDIINNSESSFSVYCNLVQLQTVGNSLQQLLRTVPVTSSTLGNIVHKEFSAPHYIDVLTRQFDTVEIWIANDFGELIDFQFGKVILKLHFRRKTLLTR